MKAKEYILNKNKRSIIGLVLTIVITLFCNNITAGETSVNLGTANRFAVLAASTITSVPTSAIKGDVGLSPSARSAITGLTAVEVNGTIFASDDNAAVAAMLSQAQGDVGIAFLNSSPAVRPGGIDVSSFGGGAGELGGRTLSPGLYNSAPGSYDITLSDLTLDAGGNINAVWVFQMASTLNVLPDRHIILTGGAQSGNIFWQVGSSATIGTSAVFEGTIMAYASITLQTGAKVNGRVLAQNGAITLDANTIVIPTVQVVPKPTSPKFQSVKYSPHGPVTLSIIITPGFPLILQKSDNLINWTIISSEVLNVSPFVFTDQTSVSDTKRFYRALYQ